MNGRHKTNGINGNGSDMKSNRKHVIVAAAGAANGGSSTAESNHDHSLHQHHHQQNGDNGANRTSHPSIVVSPSRDLSPNGSGGGNGGGGGSAAGDGAQLELFVRAGKDGERLGGCPVCQRVLLVLATKSSIGGNLSFTVTTVNISRPPSDFRRLNSCRLPVLVDRDRGDVLTDLDEIIQYVDARFPSPSLAYDGSSPAVAACRDVFSRFSFFVKDVSHSAGPLLAELRRLDAYLLDSGRRYMLRDDRLDHIDCMMLPKLQHIRVVAKAYKDFDVPADLVGLWRYLASAYSLDAFRRTCPSDQEIVHHWQCKPECCRQMSKEKQAFYSPEGSPRYSMDMPKGIKLVYA